MMLEMGELFQLSVILHFPPEVYLQRGVRELAPLLVRALHENEISALQFLRGGLARVTVVARLTGRNFCPVIFYLRTPLSLLRQLIVKLFPSTSVTCLLRFPMILSVSHSSPLVTCSLFIPPYTKTFLVSVMALVFC